MAPAAPIADLSGTTLGEYQIVSPIGRGGMGVVYEGLHPLIGKRVAVKVLTPEASKQEDAVDRFLAEARAVNAVRHRGIVDIFGFGKVPGGSQYFVMELLEGLAFDELIHQRAPFSAGDALRWVDEVLDALDAAHHAGVIHRDIKPSNLFLVDGGRGQPYVKLLDFGVAKLVPFRGQATPQTNVNSVVGTPDYMAPEQARGQAISGQTDMYALGCVLYELLTGKRIFVADGALEVMFAHVEKAPVPPSKVNASLPPAVDKLVLHFVEKNPKDRPKNARAAREEVHALLKELGEVGSLPPPSARSVDPVKGASHGGGAAIFATIIVPEKQTVGSHQKVTARVVAALALLVGALVFAFWPEPPATPTLVPIPLLPVVEQKPVEVEPDVGVAAVEETPAVVDAGAAVISRSPPVKKADVLVTRLRRLKAQLDERDKARGEKDRILHRLLDAAQKDLTAAKTAEQRKAVSEQFDDLQSQLRP